jgi:aminopeptidase N
MAKQILLLQFIFITILFITSNKTYADSGGPLSPNQAAYNVNYYDLDLEINPTAQTIGGSLLCRVEIINQIDSLVLDLDNPFIIDSILFKLNDGTYSNVTFNHAAGKVYINIPLSVTNGDMVSVQIFYNGAPRVAINPPWEVGFVWETTSTGSHWIGVACEDDGADIWWPCKDHPSDEPDSMSMSFTVPNPLTCVSNGRYLGSADNGNGTSTFNWFISTPINNYNVSIYAAEYSLIEDTYFSVSGDSIPFFFWVLPEDYTTAVNYMNVFLNEFNFLESICGPFPFGTDKHGWAHAPYWGMEHQTIIAYGHNFTLNSWGMDYIHYHELAHEWWGNLITAKDWADIWIHEGMATYTEALYVEHLSGMNSYHQYMDYKRPSDNHSQPLAPRAALTAGQGFSLNPYNRGASVMHTLRYHLGDSTFFNLFKRWAYPDSTDFNNTNGRLCRILSTDDMKNQAEAETGIELDPFFEVFFREATYPILRIERGNNEANFTWDTETNVLLDVNIPITLNGIDSTVEMTAGQGSMSILLNDNLVIDPKQWILMADPVVIVNSIDGDVTQVTDFQLEQNYPNPFNPTTTIKYTLPKAAYVRLEIFTITGKKIKVLADENKQAGYHSMLFNAGDLSSGVYFYKITTNTGYAASKKFILLK